ncbi:hypothetical protein ACLOJK_001100 [Asimina triloba]
MNSGCSTATGESFLRQLSERENKNSSKRWFKKGGSAHDQKSLNEMEELSKACDSGGHGVMMRKRVMVVVDESRCAKDAMIWALTHVANKGDLLTLLHVIPPQNNAPSKITGPYSSSPTHVADSLASLSKACRPEVDVEVLVVEGARLAAVTSQVKKLGASVLILGQKKRSPISWNDDFVEQCISNAACLTMAVRKQSRDVGGYLISTRWQKNFWLLA